LDELLAQYGDIFAVDSEDYGWTNRVYHHIDMGEARQIWQPSMRHSLAKQVDVGEMLEDMQQLGVIEESAPGHPLSFSSGRGNGNCAFA
jgi:hypothetical protein